LHVCDHQQRYQDASEPTRHFLRLLAAAIASGRAHLAGPAGGEPKTPQAYGWRPIAVGTGPYATGDWQTQGLRIGWVEGNDLYLEPEAAYAQAQSLATQQGEALSISPQTLRKRLYERRLLASTGKESEGRETLLVRRTLDGCRRDVLHLHVNCLTLHTQQNPDQPDHHQEALADGQKNLTNGQPPARAPDHRKTSEDKPSHDSGQVGQVFPALQLQPQNGGKVSASGAIARSVDAQNLTKNLTTPHEWEEI
jgi:hypothetical protein